MSSVKEISLKEINRLAIPAIIAGISEPLISLADTAIVGHLGSLQLGAVGIASGLFLLFVWTLSSMKSAISSIVAQYVGRGALKEVATLVPQSIVFALLIGLLITAATIPFSEVILHEFYRADGKLLNESVLYYNIRAWGYAFSLATLTIFGVYRGCQNTSWAMRISLVGGVLNLVLDYVLVYGLGPIDSMGVAGAAYATLVAQMLMFLLACLVLWRRFSESYRFDWKLNTEFRKLLGMFLNLFLRTIFLNVAYSLAIRYSTSYGSKQVAAHTIAMNIWLFSAFFIDGYANAGNALAGRLFGSGNSKELRRVGLRIARISVWIGAALGLVYVLLFPVLGEVFSNDGEVISHFESILLYVCFSQPINGVSFSLDGIFKGLGRASLLRNTLFLGTFLVFVPVLLLTDYLQWGLHAVWSAFVCWMIFRGWSLLYVFRRDYR